MTTRDTEMRVMYIDYHIDYHHTALSWSHHVTVTLHLAPLRLLAGSQHASQQHTCASKTCVVKHSDTAKHGPRQAGSSAPVTDSRCQEDRYIISGNIKMNQIKTAAKTTAFGDE